MKLTVDLLSTKRQRETILVAVLIAFVQVSEYCRLDRYKVVEEAARNSTNGSAISNSDDDDKCIRVLGQNGTWVQDWEFARHYGQFPQPRVIPRGPFGERTFGSFQPSAEAPFPWETSWRWVDYNQDDNKCQIDYTMDAHKICRVLQQLNISRVLYFGDSLAMSQFHSFINKMGPGHITQFGRINDPNITALLEEARMECMSDNENSGDSNTPRTIRLFGSKEGGGNLLPHLPVSNMTLSAHTRNFIKTQDGGRLLAVLNLGVHYHFLTFYRTDVDKLFQWFDDNSENGHGNEEDLVFFRTTPSGHGGCQPRSPRKFNFTAGIRTPPLATLDEFQPTTKYTWQLFKEYNHDTRQLLQDRQRRRRFAQHNEQEHASSLADIRLLDVENMTLLRQDGHSGGKDCLHYVTPGPIDWWNHFLYTLLEREASKRAGAPLIV